MKLNIKQKERKINSSINLDESVWIELDKIAKKNNCSRNLVVATIIENAISK